MAAATAAPSPPPSSSLPTANPPYPRPLRRGTFTYNNRHHSCQQRAPISWSLLPFSIPAGELSTPTSSDPLLPRCLGLDLDRASLLLRLWLLPAGLLQGPSQPGLRWFACCYLLASFCCSWWRLQPPLWLPGPSSSRVPPSAGTGTFTVAVPFSSCQSHLPPFTSPAGWGRCSFYPTAELLCLHHRLFSGAPSPPAAVSLIHSFCFCLNHARAPPLRGCSIHSCSSRRTKE